MKVLVWPADRQGSGHYRLIFPGEALARQGADVDVTESGPSVLWDREWDGEHPPLDACALGLADKPDADVVVIQRPGRACWTELIPHLQAAGIRVVVDVDDDFDSIPAHNLARNNYDPKLNPRHNREWIRRACDLADHVTVSTAHLAGVYGRHGRVSVLPNFVPESYLAIEPVERLATSIGWSGSVDTHPGDLETVGTAVRDVLAEHEPWNVHVIGTGKGVPNRLRVPAVTALGKWVAFAEYPTHLARLTVGMVPLQRSRFNRGKSCLKLAELSSVGVPTVATPTPDNQRLHAFGIGLLADSPSAWRDKLTRLVSDEDYRTEVAETSRAAMAAHTYEQWAELWWAAWEKALDRKTVAA